MISIPAKLIPIPSQLIRETLSPVAKGDKIAVQTGIVSTITTLLAMVV
jgi:preprotein translocase subunit YajC